MLYRDPRVFSISSLVDEITVLVPYTVCSSRHICITPSIFPQVRRYIPNAVIIPPLEAFFRILLSVAKP